jgi:ubiquinone/menaquinone biosynthesis C-methylase UbiE
MRRALDPRVLREVYDRAAGRYDVWHAFATALSDERGRRLLVTHSVREGDRVLDAGGGTGSTSVLAAAAAGPTGQVTLLDLTSGMLKKAVHRFRAAARFQSRTSFLVGDILHLPYPEATFDVVLSTYSVCPLTDPMAGVEEMYRVLKTGGRLGIAHSTEPRNRMIRWFAHRSENLAWRWSGLSLGCRAVVVLPRLLTLGAEIVYDQHIGVPLWPFHVFVVRKPAAISPAAA